MKIKVTSNESKKNATGEIFPVDRNSPKTTPVVYPLSIITK